MKKVYVKPQIECININVESIIALSTDPTIKITEENKDDFESLGRKNNSSFGNIWDSQW